jgi:hypothetical protein
LIDGIPVDMIPFAAIGRRRTRRAGSFPPGLPVLIGLEEHPLLELFGLLFDLVHRGASWIIAEAIIGRPD